MDLRVIRTNTDSLWGQCVAECAALASPGLDAAHGVRPWDLIEQVDALAFNRGAPRAQRSGG